MLNYNSVSSLHVSLEVSVGLSYTNEEGVREVDSNQGQENNAVEGPGEVVTSLGWADEFSLREKEVESSQEHRLIEDLQVVQVFLLMRSDWEVVTNLYNWKDDQRGPFSIEAILQENKNE